MIYLFSWPVSVFELIRVSRKLDLAGSPWFTYSVNLRLVIGVFRALTLSVIIYWTGFQSTIFLSLSI